MSGRWTIFSSEKTWVNGKLVGEKHKKPFFWGGRWAIFISVWVCKPFDPATPFPGTSARIRVHIPISTLMVHLEEVSADLLLLHLWFSSTPLGFHRHRRLGPETHLLISKQGSSSPFTFNESQEPSLVTFWLPTPHFPYSNLLIFINLSDFGKAIRNSNPREGACSLDEVWEAVPSVHDSDWSVGARDLNWSNQDASHAFGRKS